MTEKGDEVKEEGNPRKGEDNYGILFANNKLQYDNVILQSQTNNAIATVALQQSVAFQQKANDLYLSQLDAREKQSIAHTGSEHAQRMEHENEIETTRQENMRYTLNYLMAVEGQEAAGLAVLAEAVAKILKGKSND